MLLNKNNKKTFNTLCEVLINNGIAIVKCDTIYGLIGKAPDTKKRIAEIKKRDVNKPFIILIPDSNWLKQLTNYKLDKRITSYWPGPLTIIFPDLKNKTIAVRIPDDSFLRKVIRKVGSPIITTSVNFEGEPPLYLINDIILNFGGRVELIIDSGDHNEKQLPSTLLDVSGKPYKILRNGPIQIPEILLV